MNIDIVCFECGEDLEGKYELSIDRLSIYPCETCLKRESSTNYDKGFEDAKGEG
jgi:hypothetical protein